MLYLAGWGRSGTTIIDNVLGSHPGVFTTGELWFLWERGLLGGRSCGCGEPVRCCPLWREVLRRAYGPNVPDPRQVKRWQRESARARHTMRVLRHGHPLVSVFSKLYAAVAEVTGATTIVDSSKLPSGAAVLARQQAGVTPYLLHVVRDPRAVAHSWQRPKRQLDRSAPAMMVRHGPYDSAVKWVSWNGLIERAARAFPGRYLRLRYEDFAADPRAAIAGVLAFAQTAPGTSPFRGERTVELSANHTVSGNPGRFRTGTVEVRADEAWRGELPASSRLATTALTLPLMRRYGYRV
ncbi:sulfotransferase [Catellatospora coxensis]|uniref:Sulfotransferase n=1 Tax=Catellatospora coxensis TaxID=310354 RepID=A0A8J3KNW8_9ACTN|nr:sulfotransferase [Catellatospora coxensis]